MAKEMIISANLHEKKVAILEDGVVTEFYVERSDENQGVVGNLYKGRVMKVLPGMQSAFVDIALERDAFLYVSDFADLLEEEDAIDYREASEARPEQRAGQQGRGRRDDRRDDSQRRFQGRSDGRGAASAPARIEEAQERETTADEAAIAAQRHEQAAIQDAVEQLAEIVNERVIEPPPEPEENGGPDATAEGQAREAEWLGLAASASVTQVSGEDTAVGEPSKQPVSLAEPEPESGTRPDRGRGRRRGGKPEPVRGQKRTTKRAEKVEESREAEGSEPSTPVAPAPADRESTAVPREPAKRGVRRRGLAQLEGGRDDSAGPIWPPVFGHGQGGPGFERITDEDVQPTPGDLLKDAMVQDKITEQVHSDESRNHPSSRFGRDDEPQASTTDNPRYEARPAPSFERINDESEAETIRLRHEDRSDSEQDRSGGRGFAGSEEIRFAWDIGRLDRDPDEDADERKRLERKRSEGGEESEDRSASVREPNGNAEFALRRGGRGRRRRREAPPAEDDKAKTDQAEPAEQSPVVVEGAEVEAQTASDQSAADRPSPERAEPARSASERPAERGPAPPQRQNGGGRPPLPGRRPDRGAPTISELLREGQEILVQIAKEPIAKKGARITSHIALPGRYLVYMPTVNHIGVSRKIGSDVERVRLKRLVTSYKEKEGAAGGFIVRTACEARTEQELLDDMRYLLRTWGDVKKKTERTKSPALVHRDLDLVQRILRDHLSDEFTAIRVDSEIEYARLVEFVNRIQPKMVKRIKLYVGDQPIFEKYGVQDEIDKALKPRVWLRSGGYIVINQTEALVAIDVNTGKFVGKSDRLEDTITRTNLEAVKEIVRQVRLRDLGGIIVLDLIDMEERKNRQKVMAALQQELQNDRAPSKILAINDFGLVAITRKRVRQSLERTLCSPCPYCQGAGLVKSSQTMCFEILEQARSLSKQNTRASDITLRVSPDVAEAFRAREQEVFEEIEAYFSVPVTLEADPNLHREQYDFAIV